MWFFGTPSHQRHVWDLLSSCPFLMRLGNTDYWRHHRKGGVSSPGCNTFLRTAWRMHKCARQGRYSQLQLLTLSPQLTPLPVITATMCFRPSHTISRYEHISCLQNFCNAWIMRCQESSQVLRDRVILYTRSICFLYHWTTNPLLTAYHGRLLVFYYSLNDTQVVAYYSPC